MMASIPPSRGDPLLPRAVAAYFRVFVLLRDARFCVDASASAPEEALELGGAGAPDAGAFKLSDGLDVGTHPTSPNVRGMLMDGASVA